jgi:hypothetical protein
LGIKYEGTAAQSNLGQSVRDRLSGNSNGSAVGVTFFLGGGYEWHIAGAFALGVLLRLTAAALEDDLASHGFFSPSLMMSLTWF